MPLVMGWFGSTCLLLGGIGACYRKSGESKWCRDLGDQPAESVVEAIEHFVIAWTYGICVAGLHRGILICFIGFKQRWWCT